MSRRLHPGYRFAKEAHWRTCQFVGADRTTARARAGFSPFAPFGRARKAWEGEAHAPAINEMSDVLWRDTPGGLWRLPYAEEEAQVVVAPPAMASARRMVAAADALWVVNAGRVEVFDDRTLARLFAVNLGGRKAIDLTSDGLDGAYVLAGSEGRAEVLHFGCSGSAHGSIPITEAAEARFIAFLAQSGMLVVLGAAGTKLFFVKAADGRVERVVHLSALRSCFRIAAIASDGCSRLYIAGKDGPGREGENKLLLLDSDGDLLGVIPLRYDATGIAARGRKLVVSTKSGLLQFEPSDSVPIGMGEVSATVLTPLLQSAAPEAQQWTRVEAKVELPAGCSAEISYATAPDSDSRNRALAILEGRLSTSGQKLAEWSRCVDLHTVAYHGETGQGPVGQQILSAPLHDVLDPFIWVQVRLIAAPGGSIPAMSELSVLYPGPTLIEHLPAIYRAGELQPGDFTRGLVGVLEANTQELDAKISELGRNILPDKAEDSWLDYVAGWLGLPWDDGLSTEQKRRILGRATELSDGYSTRAGLETLLDCIVPDRPRRFRVVDVTAEYGLATIAGGSCEGSRLPAVLGGLPRTMTAIGGNSVLGKARLTCPETPESAHLLGRIRVDVAASVEERGKWEPWLRRLIESLVPATVRVEVRWLPQNALRVDRIESETRLEGQGAALLGSDAVTGIARLGGRPRVTLPNKLTGDSTLQ